MGGVKLSVHPLFFAFGFYYALSGKILIFTVYTVCAVIHELGHSFVAGGLGYRLNKITLMPFGAVVSGDVDGLKVSDEIKIAIAGPLLNLIIGLFTVAFWWIIPELYAFTDIVAEANFSMAIVNFLPIFPLDGGRVLWAGIALKKGRQTAELVCRAVGVAFSLLLALAFVVSVFYTINLSLLFFSLFVIFGLFGKAKENKYVKQYGAMNDKNLKRGMPVKIQAVDKDMTIKKLINVLEVGAVNQIYVYDGGKKIATLMQEDVEKMIENGDVYSKISKYV